MEPVDELVMETVEAEVDRAYKNIKVLQVRLGIQLGFIFWGLPYWSQIKVHDRMKKMSESQTKGLSWEP